LGLPLNLKIHLPPAALSGQNGGVVVAARNVWTRKSAWIQIPSNDNSQNKQKSRQ
jgi:hypothetical protein